jgi:hypothetical protein
VIKLIEVVAASGQYNLREIVINSAHIISMVSDDFSAGLHASGKLPEGLHSGQQFSRISLVDGKEIVVVGTPDIIGQKAKKVLHG